ncbi:hypothetical protein [Mycobacterium lepromatosis]|uniref:hypothetical protein n=1 Tax=Mycobacterium lepromatosis TaxID=480418 RepID=UPI000B055B03|nr:hypothetical protein [Mycobacterium lepromatosis]
MRGEQIDNAGNAAIQAPQQPSEVDQGCNVHWRRYHRASYGGGSGAVSADFLPERRRNIWQQVVKIFPVNVCNKMPEVGRDCTLPKLTRDPGHLIGYMLDTFLVGPDRCSQGGCGVGQS